MIKSLLVAVDSSTHARSALDQAVGLAKLYEARVTGLYVLDVRYLEIPPWLDYSYTNEPLPPRVPPVEVMERFRVKSERILGDLKKTVEAAGLAVETRTEEGVPSQVISDIGASHDLIVMGKRGEHAKWGRDLLGSTAEQVTRRSATPVLLVEAASRPLGKVLVLFDGSHPANRALKLVADLVAKASLELTVLTVDDDLDRAKDTQAEALAYLDPLGLAVTYSVLPGRAAKAAAARIEEDPVDLVVLGMRGHFVLQNLILGSTAEQLMRSVTLPVLLVP